MAMARGEVSGFTVPAFNLRGMTEELAQGIFEAAKETDAGAFILEIARSEMGYTGQPPMEFVRRILIGANKAGWEGHIFVQGDHSQVKARLVGDTETIKKLIDVELEAGFYNIDIDASTLVDISLPLVMDQQKVNSEVTAVLATYIRSRQPEGIEVSIGGEIGHIGDKNSTEEDLNCFNQWFKQKYGDELPGLSKVSIQTGTSHGGRMLANGQMEDMKVDFSVIERLSKLARAMGMGGVVQHGASTLPDSMFGEFPARGAIEIHLSTGWQNMIMDHPYFPQDLKKEMYEWLDKEKPSEKRESEKDAQFYYRTRKYTWGEFKNKLDQTSEEFKLTIKNEMKKRCVQLFKDLRVVGTREVVDRYVKEPESQRAREPEKRMRTVEQADVRGKRVIVRVDWNVTLGKALQIVDDTRIVRTLPTIKWLLGHGAEQIILMSHLGKTEEKMSLEPVIEYASKLMGEEIKLCSTNQSIKESKNQIVMLENLRLWEGEEKNDPGFAKELADLGDIYVNEAFGECHREAASIIGIPKYLPSYGGMWLEDEVETILKVRDNPERPYVVVMGGSKVEDKLALLELLSQRADVILLGGKLANEFLAKGLKLTGGARIVTPVEGGNLLDIGIETQKLYGREIAKAKTVVWNGPMGMVEDERYRAGTRVIYEAMTVNESAYTLVGGGDTLASIGKEEHLNRIDHVSTGGGAMLKLLETGSLVGVEVLKTR